jgi:hypothetical protein
MSMWVPAICFGLFCIENFLIGRYFSSRRGMQATTIFGIAVLGVAAAGALVYAQQRYGFELGRATSC